ncbi:hypothetical protein [Marinobacterium mangrovicola]|uniref:Uncharacterized protein n=1 Tax=Marinobacterium mangrovicola TaxID=1476959 RepID=A0A4R1GJM0_9GAMM|nr:hypothetical protein [Marinobacterium mangrovicola]TCK07451.1 hypothetical protein CLV83_2320 [Marinobacterium mangrovicola]
MTDHLTVTKQTTLEEATRKSSEGIRNALKTKNYESVCLQVGKYIENLIGRLSCSSIGRGSVAARLDVALSNKEMKPLLAYNLKAAWELRHLAAHNSSWIFRRENALTSIVAFNGAIRWFFGPYQARQQTKGLFDIPNQKMEDSRYNGMVVFNKKPLELQDVVDSSTAQQYFNESFGSRRFLVDLAGCFSYLLESKGFLNESDTTVGDFKVAARNFLKAKGLKPEENISFRSICIYYKYRGRKTSINSPVSPNTLKDILWFLNLETKALVEDFQSLLDPPDKEFIHRVCINV